MNNKVVLGDLSKYHGDDVLKFSGVDTAPVSPIKISSTLDGTHEVYCMYDGKVASDGNVVGESIASAIGGFQIRYDIGNNKWNFQYRIGGTTYYSLQSTATVTVGQWYKISVNINGTNVSLTIDNVLQDSNSNFDGSGIDVNSFVAIGGKSQNRYFSGLIRDYAYTTNSSQLVMSYIQNGDFGSATLIDHSGNGNNGTINGATWWKEGVDQQFDTPQLYKSQWVIPMEESQNVVYTDALPYYATKNAFWNDYNIDEVYAFNVSRQSDEVILTTGSIHLKLGLGL